jgi:hypothetical protein
MGDDPRAAGIVAASATLSAIPYAGGPLQTIFDEYIARKRARAEKTAEEIANLAGGWQNIIDRATEISELADLLVRGLDAAFASSYEAKRRLLAKAVATAFDDTAKIDESTLLVMAVAELEPVHVKALARLERNGNLEGAPDPMPVLARLVQTGVVDPTTSWAGGLLIAEPNDFGRTVLSYLRECDPDDPATR